MEKLSKSFVPKFTKNNLFEIDFKVLDFLGFNPGRMVNWRSFVIFTLSLLLEVFPEFYFIVKNSDDVQAVFMCLHEFVSLLVYVIKVFIFFFNRHSLVSLISDLKKEWNGCKWSRAFRLFELLLTVLIHNILSILSSVWHLLNFTNLQILLAFTDSNSRWMQSGYKLEKMIFTTTRNFYAFIFLSGLFYFTVPIVVHFAFLSGTESDYWPLPVQV